MLYYREIFSMLAFILNRAILYEFLASSICTSSEKVTV